MNRGKGQAAVIPAVGSIIFLAVFIAVGIVVYGYVSDATPHDKPYYNESICSTCVGDTLYSLGHYPAINSTVICSNSSGTTALVAGSVGNESQGFNLDEGRYINLSQTGTDGSYVDVACDYTHDWATITGQDEFWTTSTSTSYSGVILASIAVIIVAAVVIVGIVVLMRG